MKYLLDTNICIAIIKHKPPAALNHVLQHAADDLGVSSVTVAELRYGADRSAYPQQNHAALDAFLAPLVVANFDSSAASCYGALRAELERETQPLGPLDTIIAAHALSLGTTLVTSNTAELSRVAGLAIEDWLKP
ncbi:MAG: type II toxin-antitoxin system tRNA(fMet)-specific endonuclease VapC [Thermoguttaceae bacterium]